MITKEPRIFVTGISGLLGLNLAFHWRADHAVAGVYQRHAVQIEGVATGAADLLSDDLEAAIEAAAPDLVVHAAGLTNVDECERDPARATRIHVEGTRRVAEVCRRHHIGLVHISTDHLFAGDQPCLTESAVPHPLNAYARTKWEAEKIALEILPQAMVIRTNFFGWGAPHRQSFSDWVLAVLRGGREQAMFTDVFFTPILIQDLADRMLQLVDRGARGIYHVCGGERVSKMQYAQLLAEVFGLSAQGLRPASVRDSGLKASRPPDMSLDCGKAERLLGEAMPRLRPSFERLRALGEKGCAGLLQCAVTPSDP